MADSPLLEPGRELLEARGYQRAAEQHVYEREVAPGITGTVWLNEAIRSRFVNLAPKVGLRYEMLDRQVRDLTGLSGPLPLTHWQSLYSLHPEKMPSDWSIVMRGDDEHNMTFWRWMAHQLDSYGEPWLVRYSDPDQVAAAMRSLEAGGFSRVTLPVLLWLRGDADRARDAVDWGRTLQVNGGPVIDYDAFAERLLAEIDASPDGPAA